MAIIHHWDPGKVLELRAKGPWQWDLQASKVTVRSPPPGVWVKINYYFPVEHTGSFGLMEGPPPITNTVRGATRSAEALLDRIHLSIYPSVHRKTPMLSFMDHKGIDFGYRQYMILLISLCELCVFSGRGVRD